MGVESRGRGTGLVGVCVAAALCVGAAASLGWVAPRVPASPAAASAAASEAGTAGALARAREQLAASDPSAALGTLDALGPVALVEDYRLLLKARAQAASGDPAAVVAASDAFVREHAGSSLRGPMGRLRGDALAALGQEASARTAWADASRRTRAEDVRAELLALQARSYERERARADAAAVWLEIWTKLPHTPSGDLAEAALDRLEPSPGALRTASVRADRAQVLFDERHNEAAFHEVDEVLAGRPGGPAPSEAVLLEMRGLRAHLLFRMRRYPEAVKAFEALGDEGDARFWRARSLARSGRIDASITAFLAVAEAEGGALGYRSRFLAGTLHEGEGRKAAASKLYGAVATGAPRVSQRRTARWRLGWMAYRDGDFQRSAALLGELAGQHDDPLSALRPRYWHARALTRSNPPEGGHEELRALVGEMPFTYYGLRAGQRVGPADPRAGSGPMPLPRLRADRLRRLRLMLLAEAREEVRIELPGLVRKARGIGDRDALAEILAGAGAYHEAQRLIVDTERAELARGLDPARRNLWVHAWPRAFPAEVEAAARAAGIPEALLLSVMREESGFRPEVLSSVGARGLVQIMPTTGSHLAKLLAWPRFDPDQLFDPADNLTLGARYLRNLLEEFDGRAAAAVAAYNAGENAVARWIDRNGALEEDEWVEAIPYDQTRSYARRVLRSLHVYRSLYPEAASVGAGAISSRKGGDAGPVALELP